MRAAEARTEHPQWFSSLAKGYQDGQIPQRDLDAVLIWRAASNQTDTDSPLGEELPEGDYLRPLWERVHATLGMATSPSSRNDTPTEPVVGHRERTVHEVPPELLEATAEAWEELDFLNDIPTEEFDPLDHWAQQQSHHPSASDVQGPGS